MITKQEYDLLNQQPSKLVIQPKSSIPNKLTVASSSKAIVPLNQPNFTPYFHKENQVRHLVQIEPEFYHPNPNQVAFNVFPPGFHFRPFDLRKTREYYELILVHSESVRIIPKDDPPKTGPMITHTSLQILKVLTPAQWGQPLYKPRSFGDQIKYDPEGYNYWDYVDAWSNVFYFQNELFTHTWFIYFKTRTKYIFPQWFAHWWKFFGPLPEILPPKAQQAFELFKQKFDIGEDPFPIDLHYFSKLSASWVFVWKYRFSPSIQGSTLLPVLQRIPSVRWWAKFDINRIGTRAVETWFKDNPQNLCMTEQSKFLNQRSRIQATLAATTDKANLIGQLQSMLQLLQQQETTSSTSQTVSSSASDNQEEDDEDLVIDLSED